MTIACRSIKVHHFPSDFNKIRTDHFLNAMRREAELERPSFVLDLSRIRSIDDAGMFLLLASLEVAMECNGDVRLAGLQPQVAKRLREAGISSLFESFPTTDSAARSFHLRTNSDVMLTFSEDFVEFEPRSVA